ncbi:MAG: site-specific integrase [Bacteroidales bacterium]|jgi:integrase/recombinase XerD|nr:site-specific integrase [Bacteroidales bacterium]
MSHPTFTLELQSKPTKSGKYPIYIRITHNRKHKRIKTIISLKSKRDWDSKYKKVKTSENSHKVWNNYLNNELKKAEASYMENQDVSLCKLADIIKGADESLSFLLFVKKKIEQTELKYAYSTNRQNKAFLSVLEDYLKERGRDDLYFKDVTTDFLDDFENYLLSRENPRKQGGTLKRSTIAVYLSKVKKFVNDAIREKKILLQNNPFINFTIKRGKSEAKEKLNVDELRSIIGLSLEVGSFRWHTKNAFLFSFYGGGIRVGDLLQLRWQNIKDDRLEYTMKKNGKLQNIKLSKEAIDILSLYKQVESNPTDYIFPFLDSNAIYAKESIWGYDTMPREQEKILSSKIIIQNSAMNKSLKDIAKRVGISKNISMHVSRHTFASIAKIQGVESYVLKDLLKHSALTTTENYMAEFGVEELDKGVKTVVDAVNVEKPQNSQKEAILEAFLSLDKNDRDDIIKALKDA